MTKIKYRKILPLALTSVSATYLMPTAGISFAADEKPTTSETKPTTSETTPTTSETKPTTSETTPTTSETKPTTSETKPTTSETKPTTSETTPTTSETTPTTSETKPTTSETTPTTSETKPTTSETKPTTSETKPTTSETTPTTSETTPTTSETKPTTSETKPTTSETTPTTSGTKPTTSETKPTTSETKPTTSETKPTTSETKPTTSETKPTTPANNAKGTVKVVHKLADGTILLEDVVKNNADVGEEYSIKQQLPEATVKYDEQNGEIIRTVTTYSSKIPSNAEGQVAEGETVVTFIYVPHEKVEKFPKERILSEKPINAVNHYIGNSDLDFKKHEIKIKALDGVLINKETVVVKNGVLTRIQSEEIKSPQVDGLIEVGNKMVETSDINFEKEYRFNDHLPSKTIRETNKGIVGKNITTTLYDVDEKTGDLINPQKRTSKEDPTNLIVEFNNTEIAEVSTPFNVLFKANGADVSSEPTVLEKGVVGKVSRTTIYDFNRELVTFENGQATDKVISEPKDAIIGVGNKELVESKKINHAVKYVVSPDIKDNSQIVLQKGSDSIINEYKIYDVDAKTGKLSNPTLKKETISVAKDEIIQVAPNSPLLGQNKERQETKDTSKTNIEDINLRNKEIVKPIVNINNTTTKVVTNETKNDGKSNLNSDDNVSHEIKDIDQKNINKNDGSVVDDQNKLNKETKSGQSDGNTTFTKDLNLNQNDNSHSGNGFNKKENGTSNVNLNIDKSKTDDISTNMNGNVEDVGGKHYEDMTNIKETPTKSNEGSDTTPLDGDDKPDSLTASEDSKKSMDTVRSETNSDSHRVLPKTSSVNVSLEDSLVLTTSLLALLGISVKTKRKKEV